VAGAKEEPARPLIDILANVLRDRSVLLVLNNCEEPRGGLCGTGRPPAVALPRPTHPCHQTTEEQLPHCGDQDTGDTRLRKFHQSRFAELSALDAALHDGARQCEAMRKCLMVGELDQISFGR
jgi:hypothetical protein